MGRAGEVRRMSKKQDCWKVTKGGEFDLANYETSVEAIYDDKSDYKKRIKKARKEIDELQRLMYAHDRYGMLLIFQAMDAAGKDGTIRHVFSGVNPHGVSVHPFKRPTSEETDHDFLWRSSEHLPRRGEISIFNRSYYEEVLVAKVHPKIVTDVQRVPVGDLDELWEGRYASIRDHEAHLVRNGIPVLKFFLNVSKAEQTRRFVSRIDEPEKTWKFNEGDVEEAKHWGAYQEAYQDAISATARPEAPWFVIPADDKKTMRLLVAERVKEQLESLKMSYPEVSDERRAEVKDIREVLAKELGE